MDRNRPEPLIYVAWYRELTRHVFADELGDFFSRCLLRPEPTPSSREGERSKSRPSENAAWPISDKRININQDGPKPPLEKPLHCPIRSDDGQGQRHGPDFEGFETTFPQRNTIPCHVVMRPSDKRMS